MRIIELQWRNLFSYGNDVQTLDLSDGGKLWQVAGRSGAGKSVIMSLPKLLFFGRTDGVSANSVANRINKNGWLRGVVAKNGDTYVIERTFSPSGLTVSKNGVEIDKAGKKNMEEVISQEILDGMPYHIFANVINLSLKKFKSFISMTPADKRLIIDRIFSLDVLNAVHEMIAKDIRDVGNLINMNRGQIFTIEQNIKRSEDELDRLTKKTAEEDTAAAAELEANIGRIDEEAGRQKADEEKYTAKALELRQKSGAVKNTVSGMRFELNRVLGMIALYNQNKCPTCGTPFTGTGFDEVRKELADKKAELEANISQYDAAIRSYDDMISKVDACVQTLRNNVQSLDKLRSAAVVKLSDIRSAEGRRGQAAAINNIITAAKESKVEMDRIVSENTANMECLNILEGLYGSDGVKKEMLTAYLPELNEDIMSSLSSMSFPYSLEFDGNFDPHIDDLGEEISPDTLSEGERKRVDIAVICALVKLIKRKYPQLNMIALDETLGSLDPETSCDLLRYLGELAEEIDINVFIVSHAALDESLFDKRITVTKENGFSSIDISA